MSAAAKEPEIVSLLEALERRSTGWDLADHWSGDRYAVGVASKSEPGRLAYISTWGQPAASYYVQFETPSESGDVYQVLREVSVPSVDAAADLVAAHMESRAR